MIPPAKNIPSVIAREMPFSIRDTSIAVPGSTVAIFSPPFFFVGSIIPHGRVTVKRVQKNLSKNILPKTLDKMRGLWYILLVRYVNEGEWGDPLFSFCPNVLSKE